MDFISGDSMHSGTVTGISPSFATHSSNNLADVAARVVEEFRHENGDDYDDILNFNNYHNYEFSVPTDVEKADYSIHHHKVKEENDCNHDEDDDDDDDEDFEFDVVCSDVNSSSISADEMFSQGHILPQYPLFDQSLLSEVDPNPINVVNATAETDCTVASLAVRLPLRKLFSEERNFGSSSSSEAEDLDGITPGTYCVWKPKPESPVKCKKSNSTGNSSRRWKIRDILYRSNSDSKKTHILSEKVKTIENRATVADTVGDGASAEVTAEQDPTNKVEKQVHRRQSYLPSKQSLVAAFTTGSRFNGNLHLL